MTTPTSPMQAAPRRPGPAEHVARRARGLAGSALADLLTLADGRDVIDLAVGTPRFPATPPELVDAAVLARHADLDGLDRQRRRPELVAEPEDQCGAANAHPGDLAHRLVVKAGKRRIWPPYIHRGGGPGSNPAHVRSGFERPMRGAKLDLAMASIDNSA